VFARVSKPQNDTNRLYAKRSFPVAFMVASVDPGFVHIVRHIDNRGLPVQYLKSSREDCGPGGLEFGEEVNVEVTKALAALQPLYGKDNVEIVTVDGQRVRGVVKSMKTTQALTTPSVKIECANGEVIKIPFPTIAEIKDHNTGRQEQ
jgi:hypothetical protein